MISAASVHRRGAALIALALLGACASTTPPPAAPSSATATTAQAAAEGQRLIGFLDAQWEARVALSPEYQTVLGRKTAYSQWTDRTPAAADRRRALIEAQLAALQQEFRPENLDSEGQLNYALAVYLLTDELKLDAFRDQAYPLSQFSGIHSSIPVFLANNHRIDTVTDAEDYIARVRGVANVLDQAASEVEAGIKAGYPLPAFSYPLIVESARNAKDGAAVRADFGRKVDALGLASDVRARLDMAFAAAIREGYQPGYERFAQRVAAAAQAGKVSENLGIGHRPGGEAYYNALLASFTTTSMTADEIHALGLAETERLHTEMRAIMAKVGYTGSLQDFFAFMRTAPQFYLPNTDAGREAYLEAARGYVAGITPRLPELFVTLPKAPIEVRRVEVFRERAAGKAFYNQPTPDGSRPGIFYANLAEMADMPTYQLEALVYHEAVPGHHMQRSIQIEMQGLPKFRQFGGFTAFTEGWGLYSELLPKEIGFYQDPYSDFGRLAMELWRAGRLVVDTGLHAKGWSMDEAEAWLAENTPNPPGDIEKAIERYVVMPGQAVSYKIGMNRILELRHRAEAALGADFDLASFHDLLLTAGPLPLSVLEARVDAYIAARR